VVLSLVLTTFEKTSVIDMASQDLSQTGTLPQDSNELDRSQVLQHLALLGYVEGDCVRLRFFFDRKHPRAKEDKGRNLQGFTLKCRGSRSRRTRQKVEAPML
jgi:hypothetical protein